MIFLFQRWDVLVSWKVIDLSSYFKFWHKIIRYYKSSSSPPPPHFVLNIFFQTRRALRDEELSNTWFHQTNLSQTWLVLSSFIKNGRLFTGRSFATGSLASQNLWQGGSKDVDRISHTQPQQPWKMWKTFTYITSISYACISYIIIYIFICIGCIEYTYLCCSKHEKS